MQNYEALVKNCLIFLFKGWTGLPNKSVTPLLGMYSKQLKARIQINIHTQTFLEELFTIIKIKNAQMAINWWMNKLNVIYAVQFNIFSHKMGRNATTMQMNLENTMLSERILTQQASYSMVTFIWLSTRSKCI